MDKFLFLIFLLLFTQLNAVEFKGKFIQGHFIIGKTNSGSKITYRINKEVKVSKGWLFCFWYWKRTEN